MAGNINRVILVGNLTRDPELKHTQTGMSVCSLRVAVNSSRKDPATEEWTDKPNYFTVNVWGRQGENCAQYLSQGRPVAIDGRLDWREWQTPEGHKREAVEIVADRVQFLGGREDATGTTTPIYVGSGPTTPDGGDFVPKPEADDDIPF